MTPVMSAREARAQETFRALAAALAYPGRQQSLPAKGAKAFLAIAESLVDLESSYTTNDRELDAVFGPLGGRRLAVAEAHYQFYPRLSVDELAVLREAPIGTYLYPDRSATLVIGCRFELGQLLRLSGPGIQGQSEIDIAGLPEEFWLLRASACAFPLGWDVILVADAEVIGLPRSTRVEVA
ncbi:MAG TPA: phosphonate C-P lyase system protein PhnH [Anaerolineales bacterium]|nr:phosphonate C-P lyase system protein PhnH [Anaerolineales bacterium]